MNFTISKKNKKDLVWEAVKKKSAKLRTLAEQGGVGGH